MGTVVEIDYAEEKTPVVDRLCVDCTGTFLPLDDATDPPGSYAEAWKLPVICRGTINSDLWRFCKKTGELTMPYRMRVVFFDRRVKPRG